MPSFYAYSDSLAFSNFYWDFYYVLNGSFLNSSILFSTWFFLLLFIGLSELSIVSILFLAESNMFTPIVFLVFFITIEFTAVLFLLNAIAMEAVIGVSIVLNYIKGWGYKMFSFHELLESSINFFKIIYRLTPRRFGPANISYFFRHFKNLPSKNVLGWTGVLDFKLIYATFLALFLAFFFFNFNGFFFSTIQSSHKNEFLYFETLFFSINLNFFTFILKNQSFFDQGAIPSIFDFITHIKKYRDVESYSSYLKHNPASHLRFYLSLFSHINANNFIEWRNVSSQHSNPYSFFKGLSIWLEFSNNFNATKNSSFLPNSNRFKKEFNNAKFIEYRPTSLHFSDSLFIIPKNFNIKSNHTFSPDFISLKSTNNQFFFNNYYYYGLFNSPHFSSYGVLNFLLNFELPNFASPYSILKKKSKKKISAFFNFNSFLFVPRHISRNRNFFGKLYFFKNTKQSLVVSGLTTKNFNSYQDKNNSNSLMLNNNHPWEELSDDGERLFDKSSIKMYNPYIPVNTNNWSSTIKKNNEPFLNLHLNTSLYDSKLELIQMYPISVLYDMSNFNTRLYNLISGVNHHHSRSKDIGWIKYDPHTTFLLRKNSNFIRNGANYTEYITLNRTLINNDPLPPQTTNFFKNNTLLNEVKPNIRLFTYSNSLLAHNFKKISLPLRDTNFLKNLKQKSFYSKTSGFEPHFLKKISMNRNFLNIDSFINFFKNTDHGLFDEKANFSTTANDNAIKYNVLKKRFNLLKKNKEKYFFSRAINPLVIKKEQNMLFNDKPINFFSNIKAIPKNSKYSILEKLQSSTYKPQTVYGLIWNEFLKNSYGTDVSFLDFSSSFRKYTEDSKNKNLLVLENDIVSDLGDSMSVDFRYSLSTSDEIKLTTFGKYLPYLDIPINFFSISGEKYKKSAPVKQELFSKLKGSNLIFRDTFKKWPINNELQFSFKNEKLIPVYENPYKKSFKWSNNDVYKNEFLKSVATNPSWLKKNNPDNFLNQSRIQYLDTHSFDNFKSTLFSESDYVYSQNSEITESKPYCNNSKTKFSSVSDKSIVHSGLLDVRDFWLQKRNNLRFKLLSFVKNNQNSNQWEDLSSVGSDRFFDVDRKNYESKFFSFKKEYGHHFYYDSPYIKFYRSRSRVIDKISKDISIRFLKKHTNGFNKTPYSPYFKIPLKKRYSLYSENNQLGFVNNINKTNRASTVSTLSFNPKTLYRQYKKNTNVVSSIGEFFNSYGSYDQTRHDRFSLYVKYDNNPYCFKQPSEGLFDYYFIKSLNIYKNSFYYLISVKLNGFLNPLLLDFLFYRNTYINFVYKNTFLINYSIGYFSLAKCYFFVSGFSNISKYFNFYLNLFIYYFF